MLRYIVLGLVCIISSLGCSSREYDTQSLQYSVWIDPRFNKEQTETIEASELNWERSVNSFVWNLDRSEQPGNEWSLGFNKVFSSRFANIRIKSSSTVALNSSLSEDQLKTLGVCNYSVNGDAVIELSNDLDPDVFKWVAMHEIGHALKLQHSGRGNVMCETINCAGSPAISEQDLYQFGRIWISDL